MTALVNSAQIDELSTFFLKREAVSTWTPTVTQGAAITSSSNTGTYLVLGPMVAVQMAFTASSAGTGGNTIVIGGLGGLWPVVNPIGTFRVVDNGTTVYTGAVVHYGANDWRLQVNQNNGYLGGAPAYTIASTDVIEVNLFYRWQ